MILHVVGARPQFIKLAPLLGACDELGLECRILHTGQHYDQALNAAQFTALDLPAPDCELNIGSGTHGAQTGRMLEQIENALFTFKPDLILVYGDTNSTLAATLAAAKLGIPAGHVEAGVRSFDRHMPEEINRVLTDHAATLHFCPTTRAVSLLAREGITGILTGDVMCDLLLGMTGKPLPQTCPRPFILTTIHRAANTDDAGRFNAIREALCRLARTTPVVFPCHPRTRTRYPDLDTLPARGLQVIDPVDYPTMIAMIRDADCVITDSGGVQKEAFLLRTPCITVRDNTEWPETIDAGANLLVPAEAAAIESAVTTMPGNAPAWTPNPFGDGQAARHIARHLQPYGLPSR